MSEDAIRTTTRPTLVESKTGFMAKFRSTQSPTLAGVGTPLTALRVSRLAEVKDFFRLHPDEEEFWTPELCFVEVPIKGMRGDVLHLIDEALAMEHLQAGQIIRHRLALGSKPHDVFFLAVIPTTNLDNSWNVSTLDAVEQAKSLWVRVSSRKPEGIDSYKHQFAQDPDAFPPVQWPARPLDDWLEATFRTYNIEDRKHPSLLRLIGARPNLA
jgi:hypothetical protein